MKPVLLQKPDVALIAMTRGILGIGIGLVLADKMSAEQRKAAGWALIGVGLITTFPLVAEVLSSGEGCSRDKD